MAHTIGHATYDQHKSHTELSMKIDTARYRTKGWSLTIPLAATPLTITVISYRLGDQIPI